MTSEVIIKNKSGIVLAADSAVTISQGSIQQKVYNTANKLFSLSKEYPVGILVYNNAAINEIPVEIIIKEFRAQHGKNNYATISKCSEAFKSFVEDFVKSHTSTDNRKIQLCTYFQEYLNYLSMLINNVSANVAQIYDIIKDQEKNLEDIIIQQKRQRFDSDDINQYYETLTSKQLGLDLFNLRLGLKLTKEDVKKLFFLYLSFINHITGFAICGYGSSEIYPAISKMEIIGLIGDNFYIINDENIVSSTSCGIVPLAQRDMMDTFLRGVSDSVLQQFQKMLNETVDKTLNEIQAVFKLPDEIFLTLLDNIKKDIVANFGLDDYINHVQISPRLDALDNLSKEEMAELAEYLIKLQAISYKVSNNLEQVGGPIDVAIISKHDGFIWKQRKLYFPADLNFHFFENYFK